MKERILTGVVLLIAVTAFILYASDYMFGLGIFFVSMLAAYEWTKLSKLDVDQMLRYLAAFMILNIFVVGLYDYLQYLFVLFWAYAIYLLYSYEKSKLENLSKPKLVAIGGFVILPFAACLHILHQNSISWIFLFILVVAMADSGAYFVGKKFGKRKLSPNLSPNKTVEGLLGGAVLSFATSAIFLYFMDLGFANFIKMLIICVIVSVLSVAGDLFESMIKRMADVKDSGNLLPGHGGILDRVDGYMPTLPVFVMLGYFAGVFVL